MINEEDPPPENFRLLSVAPTVKDLNDHNPYIRACKIKEAYNSVDHYLDVQFRVLREDFVSPLRKGLTEFIGNGQSYKNNDLRVYKKVKLVASAEINRNNNVGIRVFFGVLKNVRWEDSKRFMHGGLVLLSSDNFTTIIFATIIDRDEKKLREGYIIVQPIDQTLITREMYDPTYTMLESKIYFEPYQAVLSAMQIMDDRNFPMRRYLVDASTDSRLPNYLENESLFSEIDTPWQAKLKRRLDASQYNAFKHALSEEFALIQGPPGTGKTFIALEIVRTLLHHKQRWLKHGPIVVVCFTNHALDQFLEGILSCTDSIIRIGDRSKSEKLKPYTLKEKRQMSIKNRNVRNGNPLARKKLFEAKKNLENVLSELSNVHRVVEYLTAKEAIVPLECLTNYCNDGALRNMKSNEGLVEWLTGEKFNSVLQRSEKVCDNSKRHPEELSNDMVQEEENEQVDDFLELNYKLDVSDGFKLTYPVKDIDSRIEIINKKIEALNENIDPANLTNFVYIKEIRHWELYKETLMEERKILKREFLKHPITHPTEHPTQNQRWKMYWNWVQESYDIAIQHLNHLKMEYHLKNRELTKAREIVDLDILIQHEIIGLTTTAAARLHVTLHGLHAPIVLVEEAAEILESHIVCSMTQHCQHVILIGDHKQLRPKPSDYSIGKDYNLEISLFERMVNIRGECNQLTCQHRMRPEIVNLITPSIYSTLNNDKTVYDFPNIKGLEKNLFFLNHDNSEYKHNEESWTNPFEAKFLITFARHLVKQGYETKEITVLCTYIGQLFELRKEKNKFPILKNLYITTVDNFQGEENRIILLSLVRNNGEGKIGFLKEENRVCVALSRAREGLYVTGNMKDLIVKNQIWPKLNKIFKDQESIGESITLRCQNHPEQKTRVKSPNDFQQCPEGGCLKICNYQLNCGHACTSVCHILDKEHEKYQCKESCIKACSDGHPCPLKCWEGCKPCRVLVSCTLKCGHTVEKPCSVDANTFPCPHKVKVVLPDCEHEVEKKCYLPIERTPCTHPCENRVESCGHACVLKCHVNKDPEHVEYKCEKECAKECDNEHPCKKLCYQDCGTCSVIMKKVRSCGHVFPRVLCSEKIEESFCNRPCKRKIPDCGHDCPMKCSEPCGNCPKKVEKVSTCGHKVTLKCCEKATTDKCNDSCRKILICGHPCNRRCKDPCTIQCEVEVKLYQAGLCGHVFSVPCYLQNIDPKNPALLKYCKEPCSTKLECKHPCSGNCGECLQGRIHVQCKEPCSKILICGHECSIPCREECQPCKKPCEIRCKHSKCNKKCGLPCILCNEKCALGCEHQRCTKRCSQPCNIEPCNEPCKKLLKCNHPCVGFCGEPCPPLCRICNKDELTEILFGNEDEPDARFVYLEDCKHCIESDGLTQWMTQSSDRSVGLKRCPKCKSLITNCMRVSNQIKQHLNGVLRVKEKIFSENRKNLTEIQENHITRLTELRKNELLLEFQELEVLSQKMLDRGSLVNTTVTNKKRKQELSLRELDAFKVKLDILERLLDILSSIKNRETPSYKLLKDQVSVIVNSIPEEWLITKQNLDDIQLELNRLQYLVGVCNKMMTNKSDFGGVFEKVLSIKRFTEEHESEVNNEMRKINESITRVEREMIVKAMNLSQGHWYACPNGHFYAIGECGGATQEGRCNECNAAIGGTQHRLLRTNRLAPEMDGATHSAWEGPLH